MSLRTRCTTLFGVEHPILNAPMGGGDAPAALAAAVSEAGGLGMIGGSSLGGAAWLREQIRGVRTRTGKPFGVGFVSHFPGAGELMRVALDEGVRIVAHSFADPTPFVDEAHRAGALVICQVRTVEDARQAAGAGVDVVTAQGTEAGGHTGEVSTLPLVPAVIDAVAPLPVIAAGGIADGRGIAAALVLGADAVWLGTRFLATPEAGVPAGYKDRVLGAGTGDTIFSEVFDLATRGRGPRACGAGRSATRSPTGGTGARRSCATPSAARSTAATSPRTIPIACPSTRARSPGSSPPPSRPASWCAGWPARPSRCCERAPAS